MCGCLHRLASRTASRDAQAFSNLTFSVEADEIMRFTIQKQHHTVIMMISSLFDVYGLSIGAAGFRDSALHSL